MTIREYLEKEIEAVEQEIQTLHQKKQKILIQMLKGQYNKTELEHIKHQIRTKELRKTQLKKREKNEPRRKIKE